MIDEDLEKYRGRSTAAWCDNTGVIDKITSDGNRILEFMCKATNASLIELEDAVVRVVGLDSGEAKHNFDFAMVALDEMMDPTPKEYAIHSRDGAFRWGDFTSYVPRYAMSNAFLYVDPKDVYWKKQISGHRTHVQTYRKCFMQLKTFKNIRRR